jgi:hypothetical protein
MRGQMFVVPCVTLLLVILLLGVSIHMEQTRSSASFYQSFYNLKSQLERTVDLSLLNHESVEGNLDDFIAFSSEINSRKGYVESVEYDLSPGRITLTVSLRSSDSYLTSDIILDRTVFG